MSKIVALTVKTGQFPAKGLLSDTVVDQPQMGVLQVYTGV